MSGRNLTPPFFASPPGEYQQGYFSDLVRAFALYVFQQQQAGEGRNTFTVFTDLKTNDVGLEPGSVFEVDGFVKVSRLSNPHPAGSSATSGVGSVTVVTP